MHITLFMMAIIMLLRANPFRIWIGNFNLLNLKFLVFFELIQQQKNASHVPRVEKL